MENIFESKFDMGFHFSNSLQRSFLLPHSSMSTTSWTSFNIVTQAPAAGSFLSRKKAKTSADHVADIFAIFLMIGKILIIDVDYFLEMTTMTTTTTELTVAPSETSGTPEK